MEEALPETTTFIVGNGLGMAIDPERFSLKKAMENALNGNREVVEKYFFASFPELQESKKDALNSQRHSLYTDEAHLRDLQRFLWAHDNGIIDLRSDRQVIAEYLTKIIWQFFELNFRHYNPLIVENCDTGEGVYIDPKGKGFHFLEKLSTYIKLMSENGNKVHVTTLNYDRMLYTGFLKNGIIGDNSRGKKPLLVDGFLPRNGALRFELDECIKWADKAGMFMHLHGSPLFFHQEDKPTIFLKNTTTNEEKEIKEIKENAFDPNKIRHIVLTYPHYKQKLIEESPLLSAYWEKFYNLLKETNKLVLFGYGGGDPHLNEKIREWVSPHDKENYLQDRKIYIVEWDCDGKLSKEKNQEGYNYRKMFWKAKFMIPEGGGKYILKDSILDLDFENDLKIEQ